MSIVSVDEIHAGRSGGIDKTWFRTYARTFRVITDSARDGPVTVRLDTRIPSLGDKYYVPGPANEVDSGAFVGKVHVADEGADDGKSWIVTVEYGPYDPVQWPQNPLDHPIKMNWDWGQYEKVVWVDRQGNAVVNSAGDYFDPPITIDDSRPILRITRNEPSFNIAMAQLFKDAINTDSFMGYGPKMWKSVAPKGELQYNPDFGFYYTVNYEFHLTDDEDGSGDGWKKRILDQGLRYLSGGVRTNITISGSPASSPVLLDGEGGINAVNADPVSLDFQVYPEIAYSQLGFVFAGAPGQFS